MNPNGGKNIREIGKETRFNGARAAECGKKSREAAKERKTLREIANLKIDADKKAEMVDILYKRVKAGNIKAWELLRDTLGEKPVEKIMIADVSQDVIDDVESMVNEANL